ncbi:MAG: roadblock/LC7 domain-containing protein [Pyrinomonadaceae bacterium]|nr:roadblock/LC7 domain-containing protein [Pyrinomonadaceae bacterium]
MFNKTLKDIQRKTEGCLGALIMGTDGIPVEEFWKSKGIEENLDIAVTELSALVRTAQRTGKDIDLGKMRELVVLFDSASFVIRLINDEYFLVIVLNSNANLGRGRFELRCAEAVLETEFA